MPNDNGCRSSKGHTELLCSLLAFARKAGFRLVYWKSPEREDFKRSESVSEMANVWVDRAGEDCGFVLEENEKAEFVACVERHSEPWASAFQYMGIVPPAETLLAMAESKIVTYFAKELKRPNYPDAITRERICAEVTCLLDAAMVLPCGPVTNIQCERERISEMLQLLGR